MRQLMFVSLIVSMGFTSAMGGTLPSMQDPADDALMILNEMSVTERIGQLFLVTMQGSSLEDDHPILELIGDHHISGVILSAENDNFMDVPETLEGIRTLVSSLQQAEFNVTVNETITDSETQEESSPIYIPLFIGISQEGGGAAYAQINSGMTDLPSAMSIGATWDPELAQGIGQILGQELQALGFNLLIGPALDVLSEPRLVGSGDLGVRTFGGDPFWVSMMGDAFVTGLHEGSQGGLAVIGKHFPGLGGSDRNTQVEVPTIRRSLEQLEQNELVPFAAVTDEIPGGLSAIDGLLTSHIRYQGFQGNISPATRPVSLDAQALLTLLELDSFAGWREGGGVVVSDSLGARSIRRFYDPTETLFRGHLVARDALFAGNDLLQISELESADDPTGLRSIKAVFEFFEQKYRDDPVFAVRVDSAVLRILSLKLRVNGGEFSVAQVRPSIDDLEGIGNGGDATFEVALQGATLLSPAQDALLDDLGGPPTAGERMVFFTDVRAARQCSTCEIFEEFGVEDLENEILRLYGPTGAGQIIGRELASFSMADLAAYLGEEPPAALSPLLAGQYSIDIGLEAAEWIVFSVMKSNDEIFGSNALKLLLDRRPDLLQSRNIVVFAYDVPYDADATDISKIDAYYALYSRTEAFVEIAARILFQEIAPTGAAPVNIAGVGYDIIAALAPSPSQVISFDVMANVDGGTEEALPTGFRRGDLIHIETGMIVDANGNPVPDGTPVVFDIVYQAEGVDPLSIETTTIGGIAGMSITLDRLGMLTIAASSDLANTSEILQLDVQEDAPAFVTVIAPTPIIQSTPLGGNTTGDEESNETDGGDDLPHETQLVDLVMGLVGVVLVSGLGFVLTRRWGEEQERTAMRYALIGAVFGLAGYDYLAMGLPGSANLLQSGGVWASMVVTMGMGILGQTLWAAGSVIWRLTRSE